MKSRHRLDDKIYEYHTEISEFMGEIDKKIVEIVQNHEKDFLVAFRSIMGQVNEEMKKLREISDEQALLLKRNSALTDLKSALTWFQNEAIKLSESCSDIQEKYEIHKQKIHALETENIHLDKLVRNYSEENENLKQEFFAKNNQTFQNFQNFEESQEEFVECDSLTQIFAFYGEKDELLKENIEKYLWEKENSMKKIMEHKLLIREKQKKKLRNAEENKKKTSLEQGTLETIFFDCVKDVNSEAVKRRSTQVQGKYQHLDKNGKMNFTSADKRKILEEFITRPQVYSLLSEKLFPDDVEKGKHVKEIFENQVGSEKSIEKLSNSSNSSQNQNLFKDLI